MKLILPIIIFIMTTAVLYAQPLNNCLSGSQNQYLHANDIRALINNTGGLFFDGSDAQFEAPHGSNTHAIFAQGLWLGGIDPGGNLKLAAQTYNSNNADFFPGPLDEESNTDSLTCSNWDQVWCVRRYQIEAHLSDLSDNGVLDNPIEAVIGWPGRGNPNFESIYGFELPDTPQGLAPFFDANQDGIYNAMDGDYPSLEQTSVAPAQICWNAYNDSGGSNGQNQALPVNAEVQLTSWALECTDNPQLNQTIFLNYKLINRGFEPIDSFHFALWHDFDLGCFTDDYIGYHEASNSVFIYNEDNEDGDPGSDCAQGVNTYGENPPAQAVTFLNQELSYGMYYSNGALPGVPPGVSGPGTPAETYNYMTGSWRDGSPLQTGGDGYQEGTATTNIAFPDDPNDPDGWSLIALGFPATDKRTVSSIALPNFQPGAVFEVDVAYSFFRMEGEDHLGNVTAMYEGLEDLTNWYDNDFQNICSSSDICEEDCIWAGDLNADGIANYCDLIPLAESLNASGPTRSGPYNWAPHDGMSWNSEQSNGADTKHLDADGNGLIEDNDFYGLTIQHYGLTQPGYEHERIVVESTERGLYIEPAQDIDSFEGLQPGDGFFARVYIEGYEPLKALAFSLEYDPTYFSNIQPLAFNADKLYVGVHPELKGVHFAAYEFDEMNYIESGDDLFTFSFQVNPDLQNIEVPSDSLILKFANAKGINADGEEVVIESQNLIATFAGVTISNTDEPIESTMNLQLVPNPAHDYIRLSSDLPLTGQLRLFNTSGQLQRMINLKGSTQQSVPIEYLPAGLYFLNISSEYGTITKRFIKQ